MIVMSIENDLEWTVFANNIAYLRKANGLSKRTMASLLGIGIESLTKIEKGICPERLSAGIIFEVYRIFGISPSDQFSKKL